MDGVSIAIIVLVGINIVVTASAPLVVSGAYLIKHISSSECMGAKVKIRPPTDDDTDDDSQRLP